MLAECANRNEESLQTFSVDSKILKIFMNVKILSLELNSHRYEFYLILIDSTEQELTLIFE